MTLLDKMMIALRLTDEEFREEVGDHILSGLADMRRKGVSEELLTLSSISPDVFEALQMWCKARVGFDNPEADRFMKYYEEGLRGLLNSSANECDESEDGVARRAAVSEFAERAAVELYMGA